MVDMDIYMSEVHGIPWAFSKIVAPGVFLKLKFKNKKKILFHKNPKKSKLWF